jgi:hypothetical protein
MITTRLTGGLGNQMFQYALGRRMALDRGVVLRLDTGWFGRERPGDTPRTYALGDFALDRNVDLVKEPLALTEPTSRFHLARVLLTERLRPGPGVIRQRGTGFDHRVLAAPDGTHLVGFWQSARYFEARAEAIRADFTPAIALSDSAAALRARIDSVVSVSLHVRRGDYVTNPAANRYHGTLDADYYRRAVEAVAARAGADIELFVFSDDLAWCARELTLPYPTTHVQLPDRSPLADLMLMAACRHHVIANSSFSWWGAWLNPDADAVVVAPRLWALDPRADFSDLYLPGWLRR